jgi:hypothetical protein
VAHRLDKSSASQQTEKLTLSAILNASDMLDREVPISCPVHPVCSESAGKHSGYSTLASLKDRRKK